MKIVVDHLNHRNQQLARNAIPCWLWYILPRVQEFSYSMAAFIIPPNELTFFFPEIIAEQYCYIFPIRPCHSGRQRKHFSACRKVGRLRGMVQGHLKFCGLTWNKNMQALHICVRGSSPDKTLPSGKFQFFESTIQIGYTLACLHLENIWLDVQLYMYFLRAGTVLAIRLCKCVDNECCL